MSKPILRRYNLTDLETLKGIHSRQGIPYPFPDLADSQFILRAVIENGHGVDTALLLKKSAEAYLLMDLEVGTPEDRLGRLDILNHAVPPVMKQMGIGEAYCAVPPHLEKSFGKRLVALGWYKEPWPIYTRKVA